MYIVAFRNTASAGAYEGVITWSSFESKEDFDTWMNAANLKDLVVISEGISQDEAVELSLKTPRRARVAVAIAESTDLQTGEVNVELLRLKAMSLSIVPVG